MSVSQPITKYLFAAAGLPSPTPIWIQRQQGVPATRRARVCDPKGNRPEAGGHPGGIIIRRLESE